MKLPLSSEQEAAFVIKTCFHFDVNYPLDWNAPKTGDGDTVSRWAGRKESRRIVLGKHVGADGRAGTNGLLRATSTVRKMRVTRQVKEEKGGRSLNESTGGLQSSDAPTSKYLPCGSLRPGQSLGQGKNYESFNNFTCHGSLWSEKDGKICFVSSPCASSPVN